MTEATTNTNKAKTAKHTASPFGMPDYGMPKLGMPKFDLPKYGNAGGISWDGREGRCSGQRQLPKDTGGR